MDFANGLGSRKFAKLHKSLESHLQVFTFNHHEKTRLRESGAGYVRMYDQPPQRMLVRPGRKCVSFNFECSKLIYFYVWPVNGHFRVVDGSKMAVLMSLYVKDLAELLRLPVTVVAVQTITSNLASTRYLEQTLGISTRRVPVGAANLLAEARKHHLAVLFDEEGFGSIHMSKRLLHHCFTCLTSGDRDYLPLWFLYQTVGMVSSNLAFSVHFISTFNWNLESDANLPSRRAAATRLPTSWRWRASSGTTT